MPYVQDEDEPGGAGDGGELASSRILMTVTLAEIVTNFFDKLQSRSSGFASFQCVPATSHSAFSVHDVLTRLSVFPCSLALSCPCVGRGGLGRAATKMRGTRRAICARCVRVFGFSFAFSVQRWLRVAFALVLPNAPIG